MEKEWGPSGAGTGRTGRHKLDPLAGYWLFFPHIVPSYRMKTHAMQFDGI